MMFTAKMIQLFAVVLDRDQDSVTKALLSAGVMQFVSTSEFDMKDSDHITEQIPEQSAQGITDLRKRVESLLHTVNIVPDTPTQTDLNKRVAVKCVQESEYLDKIEQERESIRQKQRTMQQEILSLEEMYRQVKIYGNEFSDIKFPARNSMLNMDIGKIPTDNSQDLQGGLKSMAALSIALGQEDDFTHYLLISMKRDQDHISKLLNTVQWTKVELSRKTTSSGTDLAVQLQDKISTLTKQQKELQLSAEQKVLEQKDRLNELWLNLRVNELCHRVKKCFKASCRTVIFAGWLPANKKAELEKLIADASQGRCYMQWLEPGTEDVIGSDVPVKFNNSRVFAPFQMLVSNFKVPKYGTVDPTPFVMPLYLIMFGAMFADVGQGAILTLLALMGLRFFKGKSDKQGMYGLCSLIVWCGLSSMVFGVLFSSYFGWSPVEPLWFDFHSVVMGHAPADSMISNVYDIMLITIYFGIAVIVLGLAFNWINLLLQKKWMELVFDKGGVLGAWFYAGGLHTAFYMAAHDYKEFPEALVLFLIIGLPALLFFINEPYHFILQNRAAQNPKSVSVAVVLNLLMHWLVELLEIGCAYLSNTLSFLRVAGLGVAHVCLMGAFFTLAEMTPNILFKVLILLFGNVLVIGLEGLSAGVQALRLNYYEFFSKFFHGTGKLHTPISLSSRI